MASARNENLGYLERLYRTESEEFERLSVEWRLMKTFLERVVIFSAQSEYLITKIQQQSRRILDILSHTTSDALDYERFSQLSILLDRFQCNVLATEDLLYLCAEGNWKLAALSMSLPATCASSQSKFALVARALDCTYYMLLTVLGSPTAEQSTSTSLALSVASNQDRSDVLLKLKSEQSKGWPFLQKIYDYFFKSKGSAHLEMYASLIGKRFQEGASPSTSGLVPGWCWVPGMLEYSNGGAVGSGSFKSVLKCQWLGLDVAIAVYRGGHLKHVLEVEAGILASVQHPNVVSMFGCAYDDTKQEGYLVTELMEQDLLRLIRKIVESRGNDEMPFSESVARDIMLQIVEAMIHVHKCRVMHRDLKPSNCLVSSRKRIGDLKGGERNEWETYYVVKLTSFDSAKVLGPDESTCDERNVRTTAFLAPEVHAMAGDCAYSWSADVYSFGMTMYEIFSGKSPFEGVYSLELARRVCAGERPSLPEYIPVFWKELIEKCWHRDPEQRPSFAWIRREIMGGFLAHWKDFPLENWDCLIEKPDVFLFIRSQRPALEKLARIGSLMEEFRKRVVICYTQSEYIITKIQQLSNNILEIIPQASTSKLWGWQYQECEAAYALLDRFMCNLVAAEDLLYHCDEDNWKLAALSVFSPASCAASPSKFSLVARDIDCTHDKLLTMLGSPTAEQSISTSLALSVASNQDRSDVLLKLKSEQSKRPFLQEMFGSVLRKKPPKEGFAHLEMYASLIRKRLQEGALPSTSGFVPDWCWVPGMLEYSLVGVVASGNFKSILKCQWLGFDVAIAVYKGEYAKHDLEVEAGILASVQHPNVVSMFGCAYDDTRQEAHLVTELMEQDLRQLIRESRGDGEMPFSESVARDIILQIVEAMIHVHKCRVLHRDLKPANCLVSSRKRIGDLTGGEGNEWETYYVVKVIDFGASKVRGSDASTCQTTKQGTQAYMTCQTTKQGTQAYMAPELHDFPDDCAYKWPADVYSFGMTMHEIFSGKSPFEGVYTGEELVRRVCAGERPSFPEYVPVFWKELIEKCWHPDPKQRPSFAWIRREIIGGNSAHWKDFPFEDWHCLIEKPNVFLFIRSQRPALEKLARIENLMEEFRKRVVICDTQSEYIITKIQQLSNNILDIIHQESTSILWGHWQYEECEAALGLLDRFMCNLVAAEDLLYHCVEDNWKLAALSVFSPASCAAGPSKFSLVARDLDCTHDKLLTMLGSPTAEQSTSTSLALSIASNQDRSDVLLKLESEQSKGWPSLQETNDSVLRRNPPKEGSAHLETYASLIGKRFQEGASPSTSGLVPDWCWVPGMLEDSFVEVVGAGSFKSVLKCRWLGLDVAIAVYTRENAKNNLEAEAGILASVQHPNVVSMFGCAYDEKKKEGHLVIELMEQDLRQLIRKRVKSRGNGEMPFSESVARDIILQIVEAMIHVHKCRVLHRDLKPSNCLVSSRKRIGDLTGGEGNEWETYYVVKVIDFGASKVLGADASTCDSRKKGTTAYMAPETDDCGYKWPSDVYSFGMSMYEIFTGQSPFEGVYIGNELVRRVCAGERPSFPEYVPVFWKQLIEKCWQRDPEKRPSFERIRECIWGM